jgi:hypothetical protein
MTAPLASYVFSIEDVLRALDKRMRDIDHARGVTFFPPGKGPGPKLVHRVTFDGERLTVEVLSEPEPPPKIVTLKPGPKLVPPEHERLRPARSGM